MWLVSGTSKYIGWPWGEGFTSESFPVGDLCDCSALSPVCFVAACTGVFDSRLDADLPLWWLPPRRSDVGQKGGFIWMYARLLIVLSGILLALVLGVTVYAADAQQLLQNVHVALTGLMGWLVHCSASRAVCWVPRDACSQNCTCLFDMVRLPSSVPEQGNGGVCHPPNHRQ